MIGLHVIRNNHRQCKHIWLDIDDSSNTGLFSHKESCIRYRSLCMLNIGRLCRPFCHPFNYLFILRRRQCYGALRHVPLSTLHYTRRPNSLRCLTRISPQLNDLVRDRQKKSEFSSDDSVPSIGL